MQPPILRAIDLYSGIGGWTLGLQLAGIETDGSFEWWDQANETHRQNFSSPLFEGDIRARDLETFPADVDIVVGSPPCTQFSFSNRGGSGDIADGLRDVQKFLEVVRHVSPKHWAMENVPRVAGILERELEPGGQLEPFRDLVKNVVVVDMADYGLPQRRRRMIAGDFPLDLLQSYVAVTPRRTLGTVLQALRADPVIDPVYGLSVAQDELTENAKEAPLDWEERRMNRESKQYHPVYNIMQFPDPQDRTARTITATCTRVSRESIIIEEEGDFRRLSVRERGSLQGFPITFEFFGSTYPAKVKLIGNAIPPLMTFYVAQAMLGTPASELPDPAASRYQHPRPRSPAPQTPPDRPRGTYPANRSFRAAVPGLRFHSGVRFELANAYAEGRSTWRLQFLYGTSKRILEKPVDAGLTGRLRAVPGAALWLEQLPEWVAEADASLAGVSGATLQGRWVRLTMEGLHPYHLIDALGRAAEAAAVAIPAPLEGRLRDFVLEELGGSALNGTAAKVSRIALRVAAGFAIAGWFNDQMSSREPDATAPGQPEAALAGP